MVYGAERMNHVNSAKSCGRGDARVGRGKRARARAAHDVGRVVEVEHEEEALEVGVRERAAEEALEEEDEERLQLVHVERAEAVGVELDEDLVQQRDALLEVDVGVPAALLARANLRLPLRRALA